MEPARKCSGDYSEVQFWEQRFEEEEEYEWFADYHAFRHLLKPHMCPTARILILGNGSSNLPIDLLKDGFNDITATDICENVIAKQKSRGHEWNRVTLDVADMFALKYEDCAFDVVIEKGALDVLFANAKSAWDPPSPVKHQMAEACKEIHRVLKSGGRFFSISFTQPHFRKRFFAAGTHRILSHTELHESFMMSPLDLLWRCDVDSFGLAGCLEYFVYRMNKTQEVEEEPPPAADSLSDFQWSAPSMDPMHMYMDDSSFLSRMDL